MDNDRNLHLLDRISILTNYPGLTLASLIGNKSPFYVPMAKETLHSEFCRGVMWSDLIGNVKHVEDAIDMNGVKVVPIYINPRVDDKGMVYLRISFLFNPSVRRKIKVPVVSTDISLRNNEPHHIKSKHSKPRRFFFNGIDFDVERLNSDIPKMSKDELTELKNNLVKSLYLLLRVDYIVTDTNNWCTESDDKNGLKYAYVLERIASYIINKGLSTKFLVLSEILMELKRLARSHKAARLAQNMLNDSFSSRNLIYIPNPDDDISRDVIADPYIQKHIVKLYREGKRISVISNDQQAMMLFNASVNNGSIVGKIRPNFLSLENIDQLFNLLNIVSKYNS